MKVFYISFPFDDENSGDYDYCTVSTEALKSISINAEYVVSNRVKGYDSEKANSTLNLIKAKNKGGQEFYQSLLKFYQDPIRIELAGAVKDYLLQNKTSHSILNIQIRAPETGFLFSPQDLFDLKGAGFKICVTCHEYKLNYARKWLQSVLHHYFREADLVFFFSQKDLKNASKHANHSAFLDQFDITSATNSQALTHKLLSKPLIFSTQPPAGNKSYFHAVFKDATVKQGLECDLFDGRLVTSLAKEIPLNGCGTIAPVSGGKLKLMGTYKQLKILSPEINSLTGIALNIMLTENEKESLVKICGTSYEFSHPPYDLATKAKLTRVPPTAFAYTQAGLTDSLQNPPNIAIFGMIREGKGFEDALHIATAIAHNPEIAGKIRVLIIGNPLSYKLLATIINDKFGCVKAGQTRIDDTLLKKIAIGDIQEAKQCIAKIKEEKIAELKHAMTAQFMVEDSLVIGFYHEVLMSQQAHKTKAQLNKPSSLQQFIWNMEREITEVLPVDIYLNVPKEELPSIFRHAKYAVKYDEKGWANNASGLINLLAYGCVLYTGWGMCTDKEVTIGQYKGAIVLPTGKYCLKPGMHLDIAEEVDGKGKHFIIKKDTKDFKKSLVTPKDILDDISAREGWKKKDVVLQLEKHSKEEEDEKAVIPNIIEEQTVLASNRNNQATLELAIRLLQEAFSPGKIATQMAEEFDLLTKTFSSDNLLIPHESSALIGLTTDA